MGEKLLVKTRQCMSKSVAAEQARQTRQLPDQYLAS